ncbi:MBL fold metallo-hydrolase [Sphingobium sp. SA916]|uniref:MBL fold metallo-hydrolase n=1 Tax=Sphingobium sp. SA916 TaxID=1851207 RepID=UPI000CBA1859|nr:MBL fold metallo-hydrolase [Sphingobium sp. SA916]PNP99511.1 MBL fold metallo-hydrolase [Sphingobium sp. SA916]
MPEVIVHRGTRAIGGSCIELVASGGERLILDAGRPLDAPREASGLLPQTLDRDGPATVLFSHAHMDHWGLIDELPEHWPLWTGEKAAELMRLTSGLFGSPLSRRISTWPAKSGALAIGAFTVTPFLTDHSAADAYMLLIEAEGRRILYSGDFRCHGRKAALVEAMIANPPRDVDALIIEGTNLGTHKPVVTEAQLEQDFTLLAQEVPGHIFVNWSAQNLDRTVTLFRAAKRTGRSLVVDLYGADVLERIAPGTGIPFPGDPRFPELQVIITGSGKRLYARQGRDDWVDALARKPYATSRKRLSGGRAIVMTRDSMVAEFARGGLGFTERDAYVFSNWRGYLDEAAPNTGWGRARQAGAKALHLHTSGHASPSDIARFAKAVNPRALVPVHGLSWDAPGIDLPPIQRLADGEHWLVP